MDYTLANPQTVEISRLKRILTSPWTICTIGALFYMYEYFLRIAPGVMTQSLRESFQVDATQLGVLSAFYYWAYTPMQLPVGVLFDHFGPRRLLTLACLVCVAGTVLFGMTHLLSVAQAGRFLIGFGSAFAYVGVLKLATIWLPADRFALIAGLTSALGGLGAIFGESGMTVLTEKLGWRVTMFILALLGVFLSYVIWAIVRDKPRKYIHPRIGQAMDKVLHAETKSLKTELASMSFGLLGLISKSQMWFVGAVGCLLYLPSSVFAELWAKPYFEARGFSANNAAFAVDLIFLGFIVGGPLIGGLSDKIHRRRMPMFWGAVGATATICAIFYIPTLSQPAIFTLLFIFGIFYGAQVIVFAAGREIAPHRLAGTAIATTNMFVMIGGMVLQPFIGSLLDKHWLMTNGSSLYGIKVYTLADYNYAILSIPICLFAAAIFALLIKETGCRLKSI